MSTRQPYVPDLLELVGIFYERPEELGLLVETPASLLPAVYGRLLDHNEHMTVTVEAHHGDAVDVQVLDTRLSTQHYARKILLTRRDDGQVVQFGIVRLNFECLGDEVRREIESQQKPLGRVLIDHNVMRQVQLASLWRVQVGPDLSRLMGVAPHATTYGRTALIYCNGEPAVELLEIVTPVL